MKVLFVSGESTGGAPRSTLDLAEALRLRGHGVRVLVGDRPGRNTPFDIGIRVAAKWGSRPGRRQLHALLRRLGRTSTPLSVGHRSVEAWIAPVPENAYLDLIGSERPDLVVVNSIPRTAFRWVLDDLSSSGIPVVLYVREAHAMTHLTTSGVRPDVVLVNSQHYADTLADDGIESTTVPSAVDLSVAEVDSTRETVLLVNPVAEHRPDLLLSLADLRPDIRFVMQESWDLPVEDRQKLRRDADERPNVELRGAVDRPSCVYRDARVLLAPYPTGRPRVVVEAQRNGIPSVAMDQPSLIEAVGKAGVLVSGDAPGRWAEALASVWDDDERYDALRRACVAKSADDPTAPDRVASLFESAVERVLV